MVHRPNIEDETVERLNEKLEDVTTVPPNKIGMEDKLNVLLDELDERDEMEDYKEQIDDKVSRIHQEIRNLNVR
jgi:hypothetical protein